MSFRRSISFADYEEDLVKHYDKNGKSDFAKEAMKFYLRYRNKIAILPDSINLFKLQEIQHISKDNIIENKIKKLIKK